MVRRLALVSLALLGGCREAFRGHQDVVATAAGQELTVERLATILGPAKSVPLRRELFDRVAEMWVDYQLLAQRIASGDSLLDSATVEAANWPAIVQRLANYLHDSLIGSKAKPTEMQLAVAYGGDEYRYLYHILVAVRQDTTASVKAARRRQAEGYLARLRAGASFERLAGQVSDDPGSRAQGGQLGLVGRGVMVRPFEDAGFALQPGQLSDVVETAFGYHIIWRPSLDVVRDSFAADLEQVSLGELDSAYLDSLSYQTGIRVRGGAAAKVRRIAQDLRAAKGRSGVLATYEGGRLRERDFARWLQAFGLQTRGMVAEAPDSTLNEFVRSIARNELLVGAARARGLRLTPEDRDSIRAGFRRDLHAMLEAIGIAAESVAADTLDRSLGSAAAAARRVDEYFAAITSIPATRRFIEVPPFLADALRDGAEWSIHDIGLDRALERARVLRGPDTPGEAGPNVMTPVPRMSPAPGGPPIP